MDDVVRLGDPDVLEGLPGVTSGCRQRVPDQGEWIGYDGRNHIIKLIRLSRMLTASGA